MAEMTEFGSAKTDLRSVEELVRLALTEREEEAAWGPVTLLHYKGSREVLETAIRLSMSTEARERKLGADILGQLGVPERTHPDECFGTLSTMLEGESDSDVLESIGVAFGHLRDPRAIPLLFPLRSQTDSRVRIGVVMGLMGHEHPDAISALIELSNDEEEDIRDWATFALGSQISADTAEIRNALFARTSDPNDDARCEAFVGLANRNDERAIEPLLHELSSGNVSGLAVEAAEALGDPRLYPALVALKSQLNDSPDSQALENALARCAPR
jgi:HEAT repeat protein